MNSLRRIVPILALLLAAITMPAQAAPDHDPVLVYWPVDLNPNPDELPAHRLVVTRGPVTCLIINTWRPWAYLDGFVVPHVPRD